MTPKEMKAKLDELNEQWYRLRKEIEVLEQEYAQAACPWPKDTVIEFDGKLLIVDEPGYRFGDFEILCTRIRKDGSFGSSTEWISAEDVSKCRVIPGVIVGEHGIQKSIRPGGKRFDDKLAAWKEATE